MEKSEQNCQMIIDKNTDCTTIPEFNAANYMNGLKIIKNMDSTLNKTVEDILNNEDLYVVPKPNVCINLGKILILSGLFGFKVIFISYFYAYSNRYQRKSSLR